MSEWKWRPQHFVTGPGLGADYADPGAPVLFNTKPGWLDIILVCPPTSEGNNDGQATD